MAAEGGNPRKGKHLFKKTCKTCHAADGAGGEVTPMTKTQAQWDRLFDKKKHDEDAWKGLSEQDLKDVQQFLYDHAADSPATTDLRLTKISPLYFLEAKR